MPAVSLLIKPSSSNCNLQCEYCFYHSLARDRNTYSFGMMSHEILEEIVRKTFDAAEGSCTFAFQGGEPTLIGLDFFKKLIELVKKYNTKNIRVNYALQTNATLIDDEWARFLGEHNFLTGVSLDGPEKIHDWHRKDAKRAGTYKKVMEAIRLLDKHNAEYNILTVVTGNVARNIAQIYRFFKRNNFNYLQFIPCLDPLGEKPGSNVFSLKPERYAHFLITLFDLWYQDIINGNQISIRFFDNLVGMIVGYRPEACGMSGICQCQFVVEADGSVYPCDFYVIDDYKLGNITEKSLEQLYNSEPAQKFIRESFPVDEACKNCHWSSICRGGCRRNREPFVDNKPVLNYYCSAYKEFFEHAFPRLQHLARQVKPFTP